MDEQLHIIIAGDRGKVIKMPCSRKKLCIVVTASIVALFLLTVSQHLLHFPLYQKPQNLQSDCRIQEKLQISAELIAKHNRTTEAERLKLDLKVARLELNNIKQATAFKQEKESLLSCRHR